MKEVVRILYGSQNYGLNTPESDKDYKVLLCPEFEDLYRYHKVCKDDLPNGLDPEHYSVMSIIQFHDLLMAGNPNCLEMLFSVESILTATDYPIHTYLHNYRERAKTLYATGYIAIVWDKFYSALKGIAMNSIDRNGINVKTVSRLCFYNCFAQQIVRGGFVVNDLTWRNTDNPNYATAAFIRKSNKSTESLETIAEGTHKALLANEGRFSALAKAWCEKHMESIKPSEELKAALNKIIRCAVWECCKSTRGDLYD